MTLKTKLITSVSMFFLVVALLVVGVWAVSTAQVTMGGTISFNATNIYATITGTIEGATNAKTMTPLEYSAKTEPDATAKATWCQDLTFADATIPTIKWTITIENKSERALYVSLTDNITSLTNASKTLTFDGSTYTSGEKEVPAKTSKIFTMEIKVDDTNTSATVDYDFDFDLRDENYSILKQDAKGYYVTMGKYNNNEVIWRLVGIKEEGSTETIRFDATTMSKPTSGTGTFILETYVPATAESQYYVFDETNYANDYSNSDIRTYLTKESTGGYIYDVLGITAPATDAIYSAIAPRSITDLHTDIGWAVGNVGGGQQYAPPAGTTKYATYDTTPSNATGEDKLWLMSVKEVYTLLGGGTIGFDGTISNTWSQDQDVRDGCNWDAENTSDEYWLRSPYPGLGRSAFLVSYIGVWNYHAVDSAVAVRPAFNLNF